MLNKLALFFIILLSFNGTAQELNATVTINSQRIQQSNKQVFTSLQKSVRDFLNTTKFGNVNVGRNEQIDCNLLFIIEEYDANSNGFKGSLQIQSSRPVFGADYNTTVLNFNDKNITFNYIEFEPLIYSENNISSNLIGILSFYANLMIGLDADTFSVTGGTAYLQKANNIVSMMQTGGDKGWIMGDATNRYALISELLSNNFVSYREAIYEYHIKGLDLMSSNSEEAKKGVANSISILSNIHRSRPNAFVTRIFFDSKVDEIVKIFAAGPNYDKKADLIETLTRINSVNGAKWNRM